MDEIKLKNMDHATAANLLVQLSCVSTKVPGDDRIVTKFIPGTMTNQCNKTPDLRCKNKRKKQRENDISDLARNALLRGGGRACKATHLGGCRHYGILDLYPMDSKNHLYYSKHESWLTGKACIDCGMAVDNMKLDKGTKTYLRYCEMGLASAKFNKNGTNEEQEMYLDHECNTLLCIPCWNIRIDAYEQKVKNLEGNRLTRCSTRNKSK